MCNKTPKRETEVLRDPFDPLNLPPGRDWTNAALANIYNRNPLELTRPGFIPMAEKWITQEQAAEMFPNPQLVAYAVGARSASLDEPLQFYRDPLYGRLSAPPRATLLQQVGLVLGTVWTRLCKHNGASCGIIVATLILGGVGLALSGLSKLVGG